MKNAMQLKVIIKNIAKEKHISAQLVMQNFMLERLLERISVSRYQQNFILKGGFLIAAMVGLDTRATMDMDATIKGLPVNEQTVREMFEEICEIELADDVTFSFRSIVEIREGDKYKSYRVSLSANYPPMAVPLKLDITTGETMRLRESRCRTVERVGRLSHGFRTESIWYMALPGAQSAASIMGRMTGRQGRPGRQIS